DRTRTPREGPRILSRYEGGFGITRDRSTTLANVLSGWRLSTNTHRPPKNRKDPHETSADGISSGSLSTIRNVVRSCRTPAGHWRRVEERHPVATCNSSRT